MRARTLKLDQAFTISRHYRKKWNHPEWCVPRCHPLCQTWLTEHAMKRTIDDSSTRRIAKLSPTDRVSRKRNLVNHRSFLTNVLAGFNSSYVIRSRLCSLLFICDPSLLCDFKNTLCRKKSYKMSDIYFILPYFNIYFIFFLSINSLHFIHTQIFEINRFMQFLLCVRS